MKISIPLVADSYNTDCYGVEFTVSRGQYSPDNVVIQIDDRKIQIDLETLKKALGVL